MFIILDLDDITNIQVVKDENLTLSFRSWEDADEYAERHVLGEYQIIELEGT